MEIPLGSREAILEDEGGNLRFLQALLHEFPLDSRSRVLDVGCGTGLLGQYLAACTGAEVVGTERSRDACNIALQRMRCIFSKDGALPANMGLFDLVFCKEVIPLIEDKQRFVSEVFDVLLPKGGFMTYLTEEMDIEEKPLYKFFPEGQQITRDCYGTVNGLCEALYAAGFPDVRTFRLFLGTVQMGHEYAIKHMDGFFNNTESAALDRQRKIGLGKLRKFASNMQELGLRLDYQWERTVVVAKK